jgi:hypothetical protein
LDAIERALIDAGVEFLGSGAGLASKPAKRRKP